MPEPFFVLSGTPISEQDLSGFTHALKGRTRSTLALSNILSDGRKHVWFGLSQPSELELERQKFKNGALTKLGRLPEASITVEVSDEEGSSEWALRVAILMLKRWVAVVDDFYGPLLTLSDLRDSERSGRPFLTGKRY